MKNDPQMRAWITLMPTPKCFRSENPQGTQPDDELDEYNQHLSQFLGFKDAFLGFYREIRWRRLRWKTRIKRQKAYDTICDELLGGSADTVVAYGGGRFHHASRGHAPTRNKHLYDSMRN